MMDAPLALVRGKLFTISHTNRGGTSVVGVNETAASASGTSVLIAGVNELPMGCEPPMRIMVSWLHPQVRAVQGCRSASVY